MSTTLQVIETLLLNSAAPLTSSDIAATGLVKKSSITSAITKLTRRRSDVYRKFYNGRSYYGIGQEKFTGDLSLDLSDVQSNSGSSRDQTGRFLKGESDVRPLKNSDSTRATHRQRMARMDEPSTSASTLSASTNDVAGVAQEGDNDCLVTSVQATESNSVDTVSYFIHQSKVSAHRKELTAAFTSLENDSRIAKRRVVRSDVADTLPEKAAVPKSTDLFRGWFNPLTGVHAQKLGLES